MSTDVKKRTLKEKNLSNVNPALEDFNWEAYQSDCPTQYRKPNLNITSKEPCKVLAKEQYAQIFMDQIMEHEKGTPIKWHVEVGQTYTGIVYEVNERWALIDINYREMVYIDMSRETQEVKNTINVDSQVSVQLVKNNKNFLLGSISAGIKKAFFNELIKSINENSAYVGLVKEMIPAGGYIVEIKGVECFMPGSLAGINKLHDFESIIGTYMYVVPMNYSTNRGTIVVSHREYLKALIPSKIDELKENIDGIKDGVVTGTTKFGVFVEFKECLTGMIHVNDLTTEMFNKHKNRNVNAGDAIQFYVKEIINDNKITLSQVESEPVKDPWADIEDRINTPCEIQGKIKSVKDYGLFVDIEDGVTGLLHISEIKDVVDISNIKPGDPITVQVTRIESATRKVFLKI